MAVWNPWHGCRKISAGCQNCYVYRLDERYGRDASQIARTGDFDLPLRRDRHGDYKLQPPETVYTCFTSDFFLEEADEWRPAAWAAIRARPELDFLIITKRIHRFSVNLPADWQDGYDNVTICSTCENQDRANFRLPLLLSLPIKHRMIICEPLLEPICLLPWLTPAIESVVVGGESGPGARLCDYDWVLDIRRQCLERQIPFHFKQTGANFRKNGRTYAIRRDLQQPQARKAGIDWPGPA